MDDMREAGMMKQKTLNPLEEKQRKQMIQFIIKAIQSLDEKRLKNVYFFILHIR